MKRYMLMSFAMLAACSPDPDPPTPGGPPQRDMSTSVDMRAEDMTVVPDLGVDMRQPNMTTLPEDMGVVDPRCPAGDDYRECDDGDPRTFRDYCTEDGCKGSPCPCSEVSECCTGCEVRNEAQPCDAGGRQGICAGGQRV